MDVDEEKRAEEEQRRKTWEELVFGAFERIAAAPGRFKDRNESLGSAFDWMKGLREEIQEKIKEEISHRVGRLDWDALARKIADHLAHNYTIKVNANFEWVPKNDKVEDKPGEEMEIKLSRKDDSV